MVEAVFIGTIIPLLFMWGLLRHSRPLFGCFCWGAVSFLVIYLVSPPLYRWLDLTNAYRFTAVVVGPVFEELLKPLPLYFLLVWGARSLTPFFYILGLACGMGFAIEENLVYLIRFSEGEEDSRMLMVLRSFSTCLMHGVATGWSGYALTLAKRRGGARGGAIAIGGLLLASLYHGAFNWTMWEGHLVAGMLVAFCFFIAFLCLMKKMEIRAPETEGTQWE
ncbi:MAG: PrsW family glutamic-type intramembrane protease [Verrucomicrobiales bacterium]|nr:PrsW family glutamic-type intramembrane protease [Verrucomicrobiales bacterium]